MNIKYIIYTLLFALTFPLWMSGQNNLQAFTESITKEYYNRQKTLQQEIDRFLEVGYRKHHELKSDSITKIPIYTIYRNKKMRPVTPDNNDLKEHLFEYLNPKSLALEHIFFYDADRFIAIAHQRFKNVEMQPIGYNTDEREKNLAEAITVNRPQLIFYFSQYADDLYLFLKDGKIYAYVWDRATNKYNRHSIPETLARYDAEELYWKLSGKGEQEPFIWCQ